MGAWWLASVSTLTRARAFPWLCGASHQEWRPSRGYPGCPPALGPRGRVWPGCSSCSHSEAALLVRLRDTPRSTLVPGRSCRAGLFTEAGEARLPGVVAWEASQPLSQWELGEMAARGSFSRRPLEQHNEIVFVARVGSGIPDGSGKI